MCYIIYVNNLQNEIIQTRKIYKELFEKGKEAVDAQINALKSVSLCNHCRQNCKIDFNTIDMFDTFPENCRYRFWQEAALDLLENKISKDILERIKIIDERRKCYSCSCCSSCCRLASSEFSYDELKDRAKKGDKFSRDFVSVFVPYKDIEDAKKVYPDYVELIEKTFDKSEKVYFYYCPKLGTDGLCSDYENRPDICRDFPNNPLVILPLKCSFNEWKNEVEITAMTMHALIDIIGFYKDKLQKALRK